MSHDIEAAYAAAEVANLFGAFPEHCFENPPALNALSTYATKEGRNQWPHADGVIALAVNVAGAIRRYNVALEFKRPNEGSHGILTALGQSHAYLRKGYSGAVIVIPRTYPGLPAAGDYVRDVLAETSQARSIGVLTYSAPDMSKVSPFADRLQLHRPLIVDTGAPAQEVVAGTDRTETQWAHVREGSTEPDALFRYLQSIKLLSGGNLEPDEPHIPETLATAVEHVRPGANARKYLSFTTGDSLSEIAWRQFWFRYVLHEDAISGWTGDAPGGYVTNPAPSLIQRADGRGPKLFMVGRTDSPKNRVTALLNQAVITEDEGARQLVLKYHNRAHSYREDIDSGCQHLGFVDSEGRLTDDGYRFVDACERFGSGNAIVPKAIFLEALLTEGGFGALLHYIYRLSEERFQVEPLAFAGLVPGGTPTFAGRDYLLWIEDRLAHRLRVLRKVNPRGGQARAPLQAELALLRSLGIVQRGFRVGVGLPINWPALQNAMANANS